MKTDEKGAREHGRAGAKNAPGRPDEPETPDIAPPPAPNPDEQPPKGGPGEIAWTASEFIDHHKSAGWYISLGLGAIVFAGLVYLISHDLVSVIVVLVAAVLLSVYGSHKPAQIEYRLDSRGLDMGKRHFGWGEFRSFSVIPEGAVSSIVFMPLRRWAMTTTIYYPPDYEDKIVGLLSGHLPMDERGHDAVDRLMHRMRY